MNKIIKPMSHEWAAICDMVIRENRAAWELLLKAACRLNAELAEDVK